MNNKNLVLDFLSELGQLSKLLYKTIIYSFKPPFEFGLIMEQMYQILTTPFRI